MADGSRRGILYVVATPIGNLGDITIRALEILRSVSIVAAEDTRRTLRLWARHELQTPLLSYHAHSPAARTDSLIARLEAGADVALVTDAGTPLVSDPGEGLVAAWVAVGGRVVPVPGPSAVLAALVSSGIPAPRWGFEGFLPRRGSERRTRLERIAADDRATVLFESAGRTLGTLRDLAGVCGDDRQAAVCRELTKRHEEVRRGGLGELAAWADGRELRGEVTIIVAGTSVGDLASEPPGGIEGARDRVDALVNDGLSRSQAARQVATETGLPRRELFREA